MSEKNENLRRVFENLLSEFNKEPMNHQLVDRIYEENIRQIIMRKSNFYYELFIEMYDFIFENSISDLNRFYAIIDNKRIKDSRVDIYNKKVNEEFTNQTIDLAIQTYNSSRQRIYFYKNYYEVNENNDLRNNYDLNRDIKFDIFLSHKHSLKFYNSIIHYILTVYYGQNVYVDWIFDSELDRNKLSKNTVQTLKRRMTQSSKLVFFNLLASATTNWMAWEVGYFSGTKDNSIGILDLNGYCSGNKNVEILSSNEVIKYDVYIGFYMESTGERLISWTRNVL